MREAWKKQTLVFGTGGVKTQVNIFSRVYVYIGAKGGEGMWEKIRSRLERLGVDKNKTNILYEDAYTKTRTLPRSVTARFLLVCCQKNNRKIQITLNTRKTKK
eukprot:GEMP01088413.1.p1 GENE.GEMP01088413.1~~GEMP01088413.1.p1  ORF type:complete len:103 (-),score=2.17 GEMP01088413.1:550-858(-)